MAKILLLPATPAKVVRWQVENHARELARRMRAISIANHLEIGFDASGAPGAARATIGWQRPAVVHFLGRGEVAGEIPLSDDAGPLDLERATEPFRRTTGAVRCVVLDGCWSMPLGTALAELVDCVVAVPSTVDDEASLDFADAFYRALGFGMSAAKAYELATNQLEQRGHVQAGELRLLCRPGVDPGRIVLPTPSSGPVSTSDGSSRSTPLPPSSAPRPLPPPTPPPSYRSRPGPPPFPSSQPLPPYPPSQPLHAAPAPPVSRPPQSFGGSHAPRPPSYPPSAPTSRPPPSMGVPYALMRPLPNPKTLLEALPQAVKLVESVKSPSPWREVAVVPLAAGVRKPLDPGSILGAARSSQPTRRAGPWAGHPFFPWLDLGPRPDAGTQGLLWQFSGSRGFDGIFAIGFDGSFVQRELVRELSHPIAAQGAGVGLFTTLDAVAGALLFARKLATQFPDFGRAWVVLRLGMVERAKLLLDFEEGHAPPAQRSSSAGVRQSIVGAGGNFKPTLTNPELTQFCGILGAELASAFEWTWEPASASAEIAARLAAAVEE